MNAIHSRPQPAAFRPGEKFQAVVVERGDHNLATLGDGTPVLIGNEPVDYHALKLGVVNLATKVGAYDEAYEKGVRFDAADVARQVTCTDPAGLCDDIESGSRAVASVIVAPVNGGREIVLAQFESPLGANVLVGANGTLTWE